MEIWKLCKNYYFTNILSHYVLRSVTICPCIFSFIIFSSISFHSSCSLHLTFFVYDVDKSLEGKSHWSFIINISPYHIKCRDVVTYLTKCNEICMKISNRYHYLSLKKKKSKIKKENKKKSNTKQWNFI